MKPRTVHRGLFAHLPADPPPAPPSRRLKPGQPGPSWRSPMAGVWVVDCKDGSRVATVDGRAVQLRGPSK